MGHDWRYAWRAFRRHPGLSAVIILTLALAIGANTAIFSLMDGLLFKALPVRDPQGLYLLRWNSRSRPGFGGAGYGDCSYRFSAQLGSTNCDFSVPFFQDVQAHVRGTSPITAFADAEAFDLTGHGDAAVLQSRAVAGNFFATLGIAPAAGRLLQLRDDQPGAPPALVLSFQYWQTEFGGASSAIGQTINLNNVPVTIAGVAPRDFPGLTPGRRFDGWIPLSALPRLTPRWSPHRSDADFAWLVLVGRLRAGVTLPAAQAELSAHFRAAMLGGAPPLLAA
ncbi:MAG: ABC transporter permease [Terriglobales bacterium]